MNKIKRILAPTDFSAASKAGVRYALETAASTGGAVIVYNVVGYRETVPPYELENSYFPEQVPTVGEVIEQRRKHLAKFLRENFAGLTAKTDVRQEVAIGIPYKSIVEKAAAENVDMIILSTHGRTGLLHALIGSVAEKVVRLAACPVLTIRPKKDEARTLAAA